IEHIRALLTALKEQEKELEKVEIVTRDDVEKAMMAKWQYIKDQEKLIRDMRFQIHYVEQKLVQKQTEIDYWTGYKTMGSTEHGNQIRFLEQDIKKISLEEAKERIDKTTLRQMELKKEWATECKGYNFNFGAFGLFSQNAVKHIDKISRREIKEYEWLKEEVRLAEIPTFPAKRVLADLLTVRNLPILGEAALMQSAEEKSGEPKIRFPLSWQVEAYRKEVAALEEAVHEMEKENIYLINKLFERRLQFLKVPR
ncbi:Coiled-coil domain-containing protein 83, partial [Ophiophagus hannah]